ncbi:MAG TPA: Ig-like domain repeat protein [Acidobacteriaceae bacterium]|nr:Ig-like domain repeat protein [Acidobacteriaceae bacterium]
MNGSVVTYTGLGPGPMTVTLEADQPGSSAIAAAQPVQRTVPVTVLTTPVGSASDTVSTVVSFTAGGVLSSIALLTQGLPGLDFKASPGGTCTTGDTYSAGDTCTVAFTFAPGSPGMRYGGVTLTTSAGTPLAASSLYAAGTGPQVWWNVGTETPVWSAVDSPSATFILADAAGNVFMPSADESAVVETFAKGGYATTRTLGSGFFNPASAALDGNGNLFIADTGIASNGVEYPSTLREIVAAGGYTTVKTLLNGRTGRNAFTNVALDPNGNLFFTDGTVIKELTSASDYTTLNTVSSVFPGVQCIALDGFGNLYVSVVISDAVQELSAASGYTSLTTLGGGFTMPLNLAVDAAGDVFVADEFARAVKVIPPGCGVAACVITLQIPGMADGLASGVSLDGTGAVYASVTTGEGAWKEIYAAAPTLTFASTPVGTPGPDSPQAVTFGNDGNLPLVNLPVTAGAADPSISNGFQFTDTCPVAGAGGAAQFSVLPGSFCTYGVSFIPTSVGSPQPNPGALISTDNNLNATSRADPSATQTVLLNAGAGTPAQFVVSAPPSVQAGVSFPFTVTAEDPNGKVLNRYAGTPQFTSTDPGAVLPNGTALSNGTATFVATLYTAPAQTLTATDPVFPVTGTSQPIQVLGGRLPPSPILVEPVGTTSPVQTAYVQFSAGGTLETISLLTEGLPGLDFAPAAGGSCKPYATYVAGASCTVSYTFTPRHPGARNGGMTLLSPGGALLGSALLGGIGTGPQVVWTKGAGTQAGGGFLFPPCMTVDVAGNIFIADQTGNAVRELLSSGNYATGRALGSALTKPLGVALDGNGNIFLSDSTSNTVKELVAAGGYATLNLFSIPSTPGCMTMDGSGNLFFVDTGLAAVEELTAASGYTATRTLGGSQTSFEQPAAIAIDASGNLYVTDVISNSVTEILAAGGYGTSHTVGGGFNFPLGIAVDASGTVFVSDIGSSTVKSVPPGCSVASCVDTVLTPGVQHPYGLATDGSGNLYVSDASASAILKIDFVDPPSLTFAATAVGSASRDSPQLATLRNDGNTVLDFLPGATAVTPAITTGFLLDAASTCPQLPTVSNVLPVLIPGQTCSYAVDFKPLAAGPDSGLLTVTDNNLNSAPAGQAVPLNGSGLALVTAGLTASPNPAYAGQAVTLVANVKSAGAAVPGGTVAIFDGSTLLGSPALDASGQATLTVSTLAIGTHALTAVYPAGSSFAGATSPVVQEVILPGTFAIALSPATLSLARGGQGSTTVELSSIGDFSGPLTLRYGQLPTFASASLSAAATTLTAGGSATAILSLGTLQESATAASPRSPRRPSLDIVAACALLAPFAVRRRKRLTPLLVAIGMLIGFGAFTGCTEVVVPLNEVAPGTYALPISATDVQGNTKTVTLTINVVP